MLPFQDRISLFSKACRYNQAIKHPHSGQMALIQLLISTPWEKLFDPGFICQINGHSPLATARNHYRTAPASNELNRWLYHEIKIIITDDDIRKVTSMTELAELYPRYPLLDYSLAEFSGEFLQMLKVQGTRLRYIIKKSDADFLPKRIS